MRPSVYRFSWLFLVFGLAACGGRGEEPTTPPSQTTPSPSAPEATQSETCGEEVATTWFCDTCLDSACSEQTIDVYGADFPGAPPGLCDVYVTCLDVCPCGDSRCETECLLNRDRDCIQAMTDLDTCEHAACEDSCEHLQTTPESDLWCATSEDELILDEPIFDALSEGGPTDGVIGSTYYKRYPISLVRDRKIGIEMKSTEFDTYLALLDSKCNLVTFAETGGMVGTDARLSFTPSFAGTFWVEATTRDITGQGNFELEAAYSVCDEVIRNLPPGVSSSGDLEAGDRVNGHYDGAYYDLYGIVVEANEPWVINLDSDGETQALILRDTSCNVIDVATSRLTFTTTVEGYLFVEVSGKEPGVTGHYILSL